jgi:TRAP-type C4-dicarboxylate transport system substrate-binding protein
MRRPFFAAAWACLLTLLFALGSLSARAADPPVQLKLSHWLPPAHPLQPAIQEWADSIKKDSGGSITSVIFPAEQLGKAFDHYDMARDGIADAAYVNPGYQPGRFPIIAAGELPFLFRDATSGTAALDAWYRAYAGREMRDVKFCLAFIHDPGTLHSRRAVRLPADMRGLKVRPADATMGALVTLLGGTNVQASAPAARDLLERGTADAIFFPWGSLALFGIDKVTKFDLDIPLYATTFVWVLNKDRYNSLTPTQRHVIDDHCTTDWAVRLATPWGKFEHDGRDRIKAEGTHVLTELTPDEVAAWRKAAAPLHQTWAAGVRRAGGDPNTIFKALEDSIARYHAGL